MVMSDNTRYVLMTLIIVLGFSFSFMMAVVTDAAIKLGNNPIIFKIETDNNTVRIAEIMNTSYASQSCNNAQVKCECGCNTQYLPFYNISIHNNSTYRNSQGIVFVKGEYK